MTKNEEQIRRICYFSCSLNVSLQSVVDFAMAMSKDYTQNTFDILTEKECENISKTSMLSLNEIRRYFLRRNRNA